MTQSRLQPPRTDCRDARHGRYRGLARWLLIAGLGFSVLLVQACGTGSRSGATSKGDVNVVSVDLVPVDAAGTPLTQVGPKALDDTIETLKLRLDAIESAGGAGKVSRHGNTITVQLPGATDQQDVIDRVATTARLRFRPVLGMLPPAPSKSERADLEKKVTELHTSLGLPENVTAQDVLTEEVAALQKQLQDDPTNATPPAGPQNQYGIDVQSPEFTELAQAETQLSTKLTPRAEIKKDKPVVLADSEGQIYSLGPTFTEGDKSLEGEAVEDATAGLNQQGEWVVNPKFKGGADGIDLFNAAATACYNGDAVCPAQQGSRGQLAIVLDGEVLTAPSINEPTFSRDQIQISGSFDEDSAQSVAVALRYGSLPLDLAPS